ncbi:CDP-alcohol phosphatidyltransferase family protein [Hydrogenophaga sp. OTU3427]|uniref:CDP-alcohol phosphatidyltransferase family protein n=1 Tax=Hydrogenophaga sp. OTU3427 TaxID=3043856 RepID=UPI00313CF643
MLDAALNTLLRRPLAAMARPLQARGLHADTLTWAGFAIGLLAVPLIASGHPRLALLAIALNRLADGLDGALARLGRPTDRGAFLDITLDFIFYASIPLAFALADPGRNGLPAALLLFGFMGTGSSFLAFAVLAARRGLASTAFPRKGFHYLGGLTESTETIAVFVCMCLWPAGFVPLACGFAALCGLTTLTRIAAGVAAFGDSR